MLRVFSVSSGQGNGGRRRPPSPKITFVNPGRFFVAKQQRILYKIPVFVWSDASYTNKKGRRSDSGRHPDTSIKMLCISGDHPPFAIPSPPAAN